MRKSDEIKQVIEDNITDSSNKLVTELLLDIRNTLVQIHIGKKP